MVSRLPSSKNSLAVLGRLSMPAVRSLQGYRFLQAQQGGEDGFTRCRRSGHLCWSCVSRATVRFLFREGKGVGWRGRS